MAAWDSLPLDVLDGIKAQLGQSREDNEDDDCDDSPTMKSLRLVNRHWLSWATRAITMLRALKNNVALVVKVHPFRIESREPMRNFVFFPFAYIDFRPSFRYNSFCYCCRDPLILCRISTGLWSYRFPLIDLGFKSMPL